MPTLLERYNENYTTLYKNVLGEAQSTNTYKTPRISINPDQPFIYVGPGTDNKSTGVFKGDRGAFLSTANAKNDIRLLPFGVSFARDNNRIIKFLRSPAGVRFIATQTALQAFNPYVKTKIFNPAAILASTVPGVHLPRYIDTGLVGAALTGLRNLFARREQQAAPQPSGTVGASPMASGPYGNNGYFSTADSTRSTRGRVLDFLQEEFSSITSLGGARKKSNIKDPFNKSPVTSVATTDNLKINYGFLAKTTAAAGVEGGDTNTDIDIISFRFRAFGAATEETTYIPFRAFISRLTENVKPEYNEQRYVGRTERFITYAGAKRSISLDFNIVAFSEDEINHTWARVNYLTGLAFPKGISQSGFIQPQLFRITIGGIYDDQPCYIESLDFDFMDESITFDINKGVSQFINVKMNINLLEKTTRYYDSPFYKIMEDMAISQTRSQTRPQLDPEPRSKALLMSGTPA